MNQKIKVNLLCYVAITIFGFALLQTLALIEIRIQLNGMQDHLNTINANQSALFELQNFRG